MVTGIGNTNTHTETETNPTTHSVHVGYIKSQAASHKMRAYSYINRMRLRGAHTYEIIISRARDSTLTT